MTAALATLEPAHSDTSETLEYQPPAGSTLAGGSLELEALAAGHGPGAYTEVGVYTPALGGTPSWSCAYESCPQGSRNAYTGQVQIPTETGGDLYVSVICQGAVNASCQEGEDSLVWANTQITEAHLLLSNNSVPQASGFGGSLLEPQARGTQQLQLTATDTSGPGVYSITVEGEGKTLYNGTPDTNNGACVPSATTGGGVMMFDSPQPCKQIEAVKVPVETAGLTDGEHSVNVLVTDAAQNTTRVFVGNVTTHNAPIASMAPSILTPEGVSDGLSLTSTPGQWSAPPAAGVITYLYQWERCSTAGSECQPIPGATAATYTPTSADTAHTLKLAVTAANTDGEATALSTATGLVAGPTHTLVDPPTSLSTASESPAPANTQSTIKLDVDNSISRPYANRALSIPGHLLTSTGQPIAGATIEVLEQRLGTHTTRLVTHTTTAPDGSFIAQIPAGASRTIELVYRPAGKVTATAKVTESVAAGITLQVTPRHTRSRGTITLTGRVYGPVPNGGVPLALEVRYLGRWVSSAAHTDNHGHFTLHYRFGGVTGRFPFRIHTQDPANGFPYRAGCSAQLTVLTQ